jgi:tripartite-type tricarboxylate transporter receptor subunit TctC
MKRRNFSRVMLASLMTVACAGAWADAASGFPNKTVKIVVPYPAGGTADILPRIIGQKLSEKWGQPVIIDNRPGAGGNIGADAVAKATPDGHTLLATPPAPLTINKNLYKSMPFEPEKFVPITTLAAVPNVLAVRSNLPVSSPKELIAYARQNAGKVNVATQGNGTTSHLTGAMFANQAGVDVTFIPYKGTAPALNDLIGGQVDVFFDNISSMHQLHEGGKAKILAVTGKKRSPLMPNMPTLAEAGMPGFESSTWFGVVAPPGTPPAIAKKINADIVEVLKMPDVQQKFKERGAEIVADSPKEMLDFMAQERVRWGKVIDSANVTIN